MATQRKGGRRVSAAHQELLKKAREHAAKADELLLQVLNSNDEEAD